MIPKIIHYCWFGKNKLPEDAKKCIESWKKFCPEYKIIEWNEDNYDVRKNKYMSQAYDEKMWAFVSDYARIDIINQYGGIYLDTDVELIKPLDKFLSDKMFCGWESRDLTQNENMENSVAFGLGYGSEKNNPILIEILKLYDELNFINPDGTLNLIACPHYQTVVLKEFGLDDKKRSYQKLKDATIYPETVFSPKSMTTGEINITYDTVSIHHFSASWTGKGNKFFKKMERKLSTKIGDKYSRGVIKCISLPYRTVNKIRKKIEIIRRRKK